MIAENVLELIPQRHPFVMIDTLFSVDENISVTYFTIKEGNIFCEQNVFSEAGLLENIAQTIAAGNGYKLKAAHKKTTEGYIAGIKNFEVFTLPKLNDILITKTVLSGKIFNMLSITGTIECNDKIIASCEMKVFTNCAD